VGGICLDERLKCDRQSVFPGSLNTDLPTDVVVDARSRKLNHDYIVSIQFTMELC